MTGNGQAPVLSACGITKYYGSSSLLIPVLRKVSFSVGCGEFVAIMGPSGSGKSTLFNILGLLDRPDSGQVKYRNVETAEMDSDQMARLRSQQIGFVFQSYELLPHRTAFSNIELALVFQGINKSRRKILVEEILAKVGLKAHQHKFPHEMSGGEQQRVAIARALVGNPDIILADEPTGALDQETGNRIVNLLQSEYGYSRTVIMVTHDPAIAEQASRTILIEDGRIVGDERGGSVISNVKFLPRTTVKRV